MSKFLQPKPARYQVRYYMDGWGHGIHETKEPMKDGLAAAQDFVARMKAKYTAVDHEVFITSVKEIV